MLLYICGDIMRNFVISDIHGNGNLYYSVMSHLENVSKMDEVTLFINGDLIDRGLDSGEILLDVIERIKNPDNSFSEEELELERCFLSKSFKPKKLIKNSDGILTYGED